MREDDERLPETGKSFIYVAMSPVVGALVTERGAKMR